MAKERSINPATAALKASKAKQIKKSKANLATQRNEKLARRNPHRLQKQIDDLKKTEENGSLRPRDKQMLEQLEKDLRAVKKAREALGDKAPKFNEYRERRDDFENEQGRDGGRVILGKRRRDDERVEESETDEDVKDIPMPKDIENMPPLPRRRNPHNPNQTPLGVSRGGFEQEQEPDLSLPSKPLVKPSPVVLESAPVTRNLRKEAVSQFVPSSVSQNIKRLKGEGDRYLEPEEADRLEQSGYRDAAKAAEEAVKEAQFNTMGKSSHLEEEAARLEKELQEVETDGTTRQAGLQDAQRAVDEAAKEAQFNMMIDELEVTKDTEQRAERNLRQVEIEEVEDEES
ncbi:hypothetical protein FKW77_009899 [Venturia effusa]|uniref:Wbp11/ELF5/Saf1 N-terminal domain-containing protein n=1 Tax=Venturia effusa TaxID=50376 RepID=A0A517L4B4_9PEZI|nr:hypothetical protein FKW77_009899 [Venturia effusa]